MVALYSRARTAFAVTAAGTALVAALVLQPRSTHLVKELPVPPTTTTTGEILRAKLTSAQVLAGAQDVAVLIQMPVGMSGERRHDVAVVIVLDRSASMHGEPMENAKRAAVAFIDALGPTDTFAVVTFSDRDELVGGAGRADHERKLAAADAIDRIVASGGTCASCGITRGANVLGPASGRTERMLFISDGEANLGIRDRDELVALAGQTAASGVSITAVGVGLDFDEQTMARIGDAGHGHYYFSRDATALDRVFASELRGLRNIVATHVELYAESGTTIGDAYGYPTNHIKIGVNVELADLGEGEARKVVFHADVNQPEVGPFYLSWTDPVDGSVHRADATLSTTITTDPAKVVATRDAEAVAAVEQARTARAIDQSVTVYDQYGATAAKTELQHFLRNAHITDGTARTLANRAIESFDLSSAEAKKSVRALSYELARGR